MWQCSDDDTKANLCLKDGKAEAITGVDGLGFFSPLNFILLSQSEN